MIALGQAAPIFRHTTIQVLVHADALSAQERGKPIDCVDRSQVLGWRC